MLLAAALGHEPELLVLDEPEAGVDFQGERLFWEVLDTARREYGFTQLMVSHNLPLAAHYATHVICLNKCVRAEGPPRTTLTAATLLNLFGVPIHLYPDQCDGADPACPQCGALHGPDHLPSDPGQRLNVLAPRPAGAALCTVPPGGHGSAGPIRPKRAIPPGEILMPDFSPVYTLIGLLPLDCLQARFMGNRPCWVCCCSRPWQPCWAWRSSISAWPSFPTPSGTRPSPEWPWA